MHPGTSKTYVECLSCGAKRAISDLASVGTCDRCGYVGWARSALLTERERRMIREVPVVGAPRRRRSSLPCRGLLTPDRANVPHDDARAVAGQVRARPGGASVVDPSNEPRRRSRPSQVDEVWRRGNDAVTFGRQAAPDMADGESERVGTLVVRVWIEDGDSRLRARIVSRRDLTVDDEVSLAVVGADFAAVIVTDWLHAFERAR